MFYVTVKNIKTKRFEVLILFSSLCVGDVIKWSSDDSGKTAAEWKIVNVQKI